ncbi:MAG: hypothetical protein KDD62_15595, partial [Bdellovibrionales bacterium]|nr:hypothetical protein [Bdellovibrionales bacterium]
MKSLLAAIAATLGGLSIVGVNELAYRIFANTSYIGTWMRGSDLNASRYQVYFKPWNFYLQLAYDWYGYFIFIPFGVVALLLIKFVFDATILKKSAKNDGALNLSHYVSLFVISALALTVLSVPSWKFDRVFVSYAPLLAAMMGYSIALLPSLVATERRSLNYMLNVPLGAIVLFFGFSAFQLQATELDKFKSGGYQKYSALYDFVRALPGSSIGFLGPKAYFGRSRVLEAHTNKVVQYVVPENFAQTEIETSIGKLMSRSIGYLNVSQLIDPETLKQVYDKLNSPYYYK